MKTNEESCESTYVVYHYCDLYAFLNIMRTKTLWLSDVKKSNDAEEGKFLLKKLQNYIAKDGTGVAIGFKTKYLEKFRTAIRDRDVKMTSRFGRVNYKDDEMEYLLHLKSRYLIDLVKRISEAKNEASVRYGELAVEEILGEVAENSIFYKSELFSEEDEYIKKSRKIEKRFLGYY